MPSLDEILQNGDAWHSVFCSVFSSMSKEAKIDISKKFRTMIEETIPSNNFNEETKKEYLTAYKRAYYYATNKTYES